MSGSIVSSSIGFGDHEIMGFNFGISQIYHSTAYLLLLPVWKDQFPFPVTYQCRTVSAVAPLDSGTPKTWVSTLEFHKYLKRIQSYNNFRFSSRHIWFSDMPLLLFLFFVILANWNIYLNWPNILIYISFTAIFSHSGVGEKKLTVRKVDIAMSAHARLLPCCLQP